MKEITCRECDYYWCDDNEEFETCHYIGPDGTAPCEDDIFIERDDFVNSFIGLEENDYD